MMIAIVLVLLLLMVIAIVLGTLRMSLLTCAAVRGEEVGRRRQWIAG